MPTAPWYRNTRGEWFVLAQGLLFVLLVVAPATLPVLPPWPFPGSRPAGILLLAVGLFLTAIAVWPHGRHLTPFAAPKAGSVLIERGPYRLMRHPIYSGLICAACGWALWRQGSLTLLLAVLLAILFDRKATLEERWLLQTFPGYAEYRKRVRKLVPFLY